MEFWNNENFLIWFSDLSLQLFFLCLESELRKRDNRECCQNLWAIFIINFLLQRVTTSIDLLDGLFRGGFTGQFLMDALSQIGTVCSGKTGQRDTTVAKHIDVMFLPEGITDFGGQSRKGKHTDLRKDMIPISWRESTSKWRIFNISISLTHSWNKSSDSRIVATRVAPWR